MAEPIKIDGLREFNKAIKAIDDGLPKMVRLVFNEAAEGVAGPARRRVPTRRGKAAKSIKPKSTRQLVRISAGGRSAPHYPWLDFGGAVGRKRSVRRPFRKEGRYLYAEYFKQKRSGEFPDMMEDALIKLGKAAGLEVER